MAVEALYALRFGHAGTSDPEANGGVVALENGRLFGGDSRHAYTGKYSLAGNTVIGNIHVLRHHPQSEPSGAWGTEENEFDVRFVASLNEDHTQANGSFSKGAAKEGIALFRVAELP